jgi:glycosyltransferase involved in cell wall biosynthesis
MWMNQSVCVVLPTYNEKDSIRDCIARFRATGLVDEVLVVNNNAAPGTSDEVAKTDAREVYEPRQGYGAAIRRGFRETDADLIVVSEPDATFEPRDIVKLLAYADDFDFVVGTRTAKEFIWEGANMGAFLKWGNYFVAKVIEVLFNTVNLTDVGCTLRLIKRDALRRMEPHFTIHDSHFGPEMMLLACVLGVPFVQIPVNYRSRVGLSSVTGSKWKALGVGLRMLLLIFRYKWRHDGLRIQRRAAPGLELRHVSTDVLRSRLAPGHARLLLVLLVLAAAGYACLVTRYLDRPLRFDETEWPVQAAGILHHGVPKVLYAEDKTIWLRPLLGFDAHYGMWHPPLYQYSLALGGLLLGWSDAALRGISLLWFLGSLFLAWKILGLLLPRDTSPLLRAVPLALIVFAPLVAEGSLHLDIDNTSLTFFLLLFAYVFLRAPLDASWRRCTALGLLLALALWCKLTSPFLVLGAAVLFLAVNRRWAGALRLAVVGIAVGLGTFLATYFLYCALLDYPARFMFEYSYLHNRKITQPNALWPIVQSVRWHVVWLSPGIALLLLAGFCMRLRSALRERRVEPADFLLIASAAIFFFYVFWGGLFGKYTVPGAVLGLLGAAPPVAAALHGVRLERPRIYLVLCSALLLAHALLLPALQPRPPRAAAASLPWKESVLDPRNLVLLAALGSLALFYLLSRRLVSAPGAGAPVLAALVVYTALANPVNMLKVVLPDYDRSPYRPFFDRGFSRVVTALNAEYGADATIVCPKDVGYYFHGRHYPLETIGALQGLSAFHPIIEDGAVDAVVDDLKYPTLTDPALRQRLDAIATRVEREDFAIWRLRRTAREGRALQASARPADPRGL